MVTELTLAALFDFVYCPMRYWWRQVAQVPEPSTLDRVAHTLLREALIEYAQIYWMKTKDEPLVIQKALEANPTAKPLKIILSTLWGYRFIEWGQPDLGRLLRQYSRADAEIVINFVRGADGFRRPDGLPYDAPRLTKVYRQLADEAGLPARKQVIDEAAEHLPIVLRHNQSLAESYAQANGEIAADLIAGLPDWENRVLAFDVPFITQIESLKLSGRADFFIKSDEGLELVFIQNGPRLLPFKVYKNDLRFIAAFLSSGGEWWPNGEMNRIRIFNVIGEVRDACIYGPGRQERLSSVVSLVQAGIQAGVFLPRFLRFETYPTCLACPYQPHCLDGGGDMLERMDPAGYLVSAQADI